MPGTTEKDVLELALGVNVDGALKDINKFRATGSKAAQAISKGMQALGKNISKVAQGPVNLMSKGIKKVRDEYRKVSAEFTEYSNSVKKHTAMISHLEQEMLHASEDQKKVLEERLKDTKELLKTTTELHKKNKKAQIFGEAKSDLKALGGKGKESAKGFWRSGTSLFRKDFEGGVHHAAKALGNAMSSAQVTGKWAGKAGKAFWGKSREKWAGAKAAAKGGDVLGALRGGAGAAASGGMAGISGALGGIMKMLGSLGPILSIAAASIAAIVKLMIDAEAAAKELNKKVLETAGSSQQFYKNAQNTDGALLDMKKTLRAVRDSANDLSKNYSWGITKEEHTAVISSLTAEGVSLDTLAQKYKDTGDEAKDAAARAEAFGDAVHVAVAYSREFGVSLSEVSNFQGEMMTEMGDSIDEVKKAFHSMSKGAADSGIAANKFFAIIRGISSDLNLYNTRMEDAVHLLTQLGKVMSPRNAQKFMSYAMNAMKGMGRVERIQTTMLAGPGKTGKVVDRDIDRGTKSLATKMASFGKGNAEMYQDAIEKGGESFTKVLADLPENMRGELREAQLELSLKRKSRGGGLVGTSIAAGETSAGGQLQVVSDMIKRFTGGKSIADSIGNMNTQMFAESRGISVDQLNQMAKMEIAMNDQRDLLKKGLRDDKVRAKLEKAGIKLSGNDAKDQKAIEEAGLDQIMDTLDEGDQKALAEAGKEIDYAKQTSTFTSTIAQKIEMLVDWLMNKLWDLMTDVYDAIASIASSKWFGGDSGTGKIFQSASAQAQEKSMYADPKTHGKLLESMTTQLKNSGVHTADAVAKAVSAAGIGGGAGGKVQSLVQDGASLGEAVKSAGLNAEDTAKLLDKLRLSLNASSLRAFVNTGTGPGQGGGVSVAAPPSAAPEEVTPTAAPATPAHVAAIAAAKAPDPVSADQGEAIVSGLDGLQGALQDKGIKINKAFLRNQFWKNGHDAVLDANREALLEYFLYSKMDSGEVAKGLKAGDFNTSNFGQMVTSQAASTGEIKMPIKGMASGGVVPSPKSPDQVFVAAKPGETITPAGKGGTASLTIPISVNGPGGHELASMMKTAALNVVVEWQRKQKYM